MALKKKDKKDFSNGWKNVPDYHVTTLYVGRDEEIV